MANPLLCLRLMGLALLFTIFAFQGPEGSHPEASVVVPPSRAQQFLAKLRRPKRQVWDRSRPDVQQWIQQFMYMGFDEQVIHHQCHLSVDRMPHLSVTELKPSEAKASSVSHTASARSSSLSTNPLVTVPQRLEADLSYWMDHARSHDQGRQHHYDENSPIGPRDHTSYRHGANVNYDYY